MEIVTEYVLFDNLIINYLILYLTAYLIKQDYKVWRLISADFFGSLMALIIPLVKINTVLFIFLKILIGIFMLLVAFKCKNFKCFILQFLTFISATALFGGICFIVYYFLTGSANLSVINNQYSFPVGAIVFVVSLYLFALKGVINFIVNKQKSKKYIFEIVFVQDSKKIKTLAYLDSGHTLREPSTKESVIIINYNIFSKLFKIPIEQILMKKAPNALANAHYIKIKTINSTEEMLVFNIDRVEINLIKNKVKKSNALVGLSFTNFKQNFDCDCLISPSIC